MKVVARLYQTSGVDVPFRGHLMQVKKLETPAPFPLPIHRRHRDPFNHSISQV